MDFTKEATDPNKEDKSRLRTSESPLDAGNHSLSETSRQQKSSQSRLSF
jgi:hypothetical protein